MSIWLVLFIVFLDWLGIGLVYPVFSTMIFHPEHAIVDPSWSDSMRSWALGSLLAAMSIAQFFSSPIVGSMSDQKGRKPLFLVSLALSVLGYGCCVVGIFCKNLILIILSRVIVGIGAGNSSVVSATIVDLSSSKTKAKNFGLYSMACGVGFTVGPYLGGAFAKTHFTTSFVIAGLANLLSLCLIAWFFKETHEMRKNAKVRWNEGVRNLKKAFRTKEVRALFCSIFIFCFGWSFFYEFMPVTWIADFSFDPEQIGFFYAYGAGVYALSSGALIRPIVERFKAGNIFFYAMFSLGVIILSLLFLPSPFWIWIYLPIVNFLAALCYPTSTTIVSDKVGQDAQGEILGVLGSVQAASFAISPLAAGLFLKGCCRMPMLVGGCSMLIAAAVVYGFFKKDILSKKHP